MSTESTETQDNDPGAIVIDLLGADVTLISSDGARFNVVKSVLSVASPFFHGMFDLPSPSSTNATQKHPEVPLVTEDARILEAILRYTFPISPKHILLDIPEAVRLIDTARKFQLESTELGILKDVASMLCEESNPLVAWSCAIRCGSHVARQAAMIRYLRVEESNLAMLTEEAIHELEWATARAYYELHKWRQEAIMGAKEALMREWSALEECSVNRMKPTVSFKKLFKITIEDINPFSCYESNFHVLARACAMAAMASCSCSVCGNDSSVVRANQLKKMASAVGSMLEDYKSWYIISAASDIVSTKALTGCDPRASALCCTRVNAYVSGSQTRRRCSVSRALMVNS